MDDLTLDQANAIIANKDPRGEAFWKNDRDTVAAVNRAFEKTYPGEEELGNGLGPELEQAMGEALKIKPAVSSSEGEADPRLEKYGADVLEPLKQEWGDGFQENYQLGGYAVQAIFPGLNAEQLNDLEASLDLPPALMTQALRLLSQIGRRLRQ